MTTMLVLTMVLGATSALPAWEFESEDALQTWVPNAGLEDVRIEDGVLNARAIDWDPFFGCRDITIEANPRQYVLVRVKADHSGEAQLFWSGQLEGKYAGLSEDKATRFNILGDGNWHEVAVFPFWHTEGVVRQLRFDVYNATEFAIDWIRVLEWGTPDTPSEETCLWRFNGDMASWTVQPESIDYFAPQVNVDASQKGWVTVRARSDTAATAAVLWAGAGAHGLQKQEFGLRGDGRLHSYNIEVQGLKGWNGRLVAFGLRLPEQAGVWVESIRIADAPSGPPDIDVTYFGFENAISRAQRPASILAAFDNQGGDIAQSVQARLDLPDGVHLVEGQAQQPVPPVEFDDHVAVRWQVLADSPGTYPVTLVLSGEGASGTETVSLEFAEPRAIVPVEYVPAPRPVETDLDVCAFYFPGWDSPAKWDCIRRVAPIRKPLLGYYDEANPECVDWQIKWARENGIGIFLVDWYWVDGAQHLTHWFEAYREARYRDQLKVAIMWANHNPPDTHSVEDWRKVTREWIDRYFNLPGYYHIDGKPAVFLWDARNIRRDVGGSDVVKTMFAESQEMARAAGYEGITFVAIYHHESEEQVHMLLNEGYYGATTYHEWGEAPGMAATPQDVQYEDVVATSPEAWQVRHERCKSIVYYPLVDTGWDSRPWHGTKARVISGRTPDRFERLLRSARTFCEDHDKPLVVLGPMNEWGEGSYIEPCTEFGFDMLERVRKVFGKGDPKIWPDNVAPADVGLGPYDFPPLPTTSVWEFDDGAAGWRGLMGIPEVQARNGALCFRTSTHDPAMLVPVNNLKASEFSHATITMRIEGNATKDEQAQLFWATGSGAITEATSVRFPIHIDGQTHSYTVDLAGNPRWRGRISALRFDPGSTTGLDIAIDRFALEP